MSTTVTVTEFYMCQYKTLDFDTLYFVGVYRWSQLLQDLTQV